MLQVQKRPLKVAVEHLKDLPYNPNDDILKATNMELVATLKDLLAQHPIYREQLQSSFQFGSDFQDLSRLSDMAAALTSAQETDLQSVLAELSIPDRYAESQRCSSRVFLLTGMQGAGRNSLSSFCTRCTGRVF